MNNTKSLFITDPLHDLNPKKDTTILWMQEVAALEGQVFQCEISDLTVKVSLRPRLLKF